MGQQQDIQEDTVEEYTEDSFDVFCDSQLNRINNRLRHETQSERINRDLQRGSLDRIEVPESLIVEAAQHARQ